MKFNRNTTYFTFSSDVFFFKRINTFCIYLPFKILKKMKHPLVVNNNRNVNQTEKNIMYQVLPQSKPPLKYL